MSFQYVRRFKSQSTQALSTTSRFAPRPFLAQRSEARPIPVQPRLMIGRRGQVQAWRLKEYDDYNGVIAGDPGVGDQKVEEIRQSIAAAQEEEDGDVGEVVGTLKATDEQKMYWDSENKMWCREDELGDDDPPPPAWSDYSVLTDGHHRFVALVEQDEDPTQYLEEEGETSFGHNWSDIL